MSNEKIVWGVHMQNVRDDAPIRHGYIGIGWHEVGDLSHLSANREAFKSAYAAALPAAKTGSIPVGAGQLFRFVHEMQVGDYVVFPTRFDRMVHIGRVIGPYIYVADDKDRYVQRRAAEWLVHVNRDEFSQSALNELGSAMTLFRVTSHAEEFLSALTGEITAPPIETDDEAVALITEHFEESTEDFVIKRLKEAQTSYEFEHFVAHLLQCMGYHARVTKASGDGGIDVIAHRDELGFEPPLIKVQCKQSLGTNGRPDVQKLYGAIEKEEMGLFVTLGSFSNDARTFEQSKSNLRLLDGKELVDLIFTHYDKFAPRYRALIPLKRTYSPGL
jgi:restriction system protein